MIVTNAPPEKVVVIVPLGAVHVVVVKPTKQAESARATSASPMDITIATAPTAALASRVLRLR